MTAIPAHVDSRALRAYVQARRWYRSKARSLVEATVDQVFPLRLDGVDVAFSVILCTYEDGGSERYILPIATASGEEAAFVRSERAHLVIAVSPRDDASISYDALGSERLLSALLEQFRKGGSSVASAPPHAHRLVFRSSSRFDLARPKSLVPRPTTAEQTNTSIVYGDGFILKIVRKLDPGTSPELEVGEFLTRHGYANTAPVVGAIELESDTGVASTVGLLHGFVPNRGDAWAVTLEALRASPDPHPYASKAALLGERIGAMHAILARGTEPAFAPEPIGKDARRGLADAVVRQARALSTFLRDGDLPKIIRRLDAFVEQAADPTAMRIHGDLHLGQILATPEDDFVVIDFEGEPARSLAERKAKRSFLADVAGMLRSFHYAAATVLRAVDRAAAHAWYRHVASTFLEAYRRAIHGPHAAFSITEEEWKTTLDFYLLEKCIYEIAYEANHRPDWIGIPRDGIADLLDGRQ